MVKRYIILPLSRLLREPAFLICTVLLAICASGLRVGAQKLRLNFRKEELPLRKSLDDIDLARLAPYKLVQSRKIPPEIEDELGTREYIEWYLDDESVDEDHPARGVSLFITYYTGNPDKIPHVPDWCYVGVGGEVRSRSNKSISVPGCGLEDDRLGIRLLEIHVPGRLDTKLRRVVYFFGVNGTFRQTRTEVRRRQNNLYDRYAYFSKVELSFHGRYPASEAETVAGAEKLLVKLLPLLIEEHWPDWQAAKGEANSEGNL